MIGSLMATVAADAHVYAAIADSTRRAMLDLLADRPRSVSELVDEFDVSQPAISRHLSILLSVGLVDVRNEGRQRIYEFNPAPLGEVVDWLSAYDRFWRKRLHKLGELLERT